MRKQRQPGLRLSMSLKITLDFCLHLSSAGTIGVYDFLSSLLSRGTKDRM